MHTISKRILLVSVALVLTFPVSAQSTREQAVAIDRVPVPPPDLLEVERIGPVLKAPWSLAFLPDSSMLVTEKHGGIRLIRRDGSASAALDGGPRNVLQEADSGLLDIVLDPDFAANRLVYVCFAEGTQASNRTAVWKARFDGKRFVDGTVIFRVSEAKKGVNHPGGRLLFLPDKTLLVTIGEGFDYRDKAQDPSSHFGKVLRLTRDGTAPPDNPFVGRSGHAPEIWTLGNRNVQGLARDPLTGIIWEHEHGPRGGDEINILKAGSNYGWPATTNGIDYDGKLISERAHASGIASPQLVWSPSIAPSGLAIYRGPLFPELEGRLLVGALVSRSIVVVQEGKSGLLSEQGRLLSGLKHRVRDIRVASDGNIYWLSDEDQGGLYRILPPSEQLARPRAGHDASISDLSFLLGSWTGTTDLRLRSGLLIKEASSMLCRARLKGTYVECTTTFRREGGQSRSITEFLNYNSRTRKISSRILDSNWDDETSFTLEWDGLESAYVGRIATTFSDGQPAIERVVLKSSADGLELERRESIRPDGSTEPWTQVFRWVQRKERP